MNETRVSVELQQRLLFRRPEEFQFPWAGEPLPGWAWWPVTAMSLLFGLLVVILFYRREARAIRHAMLGRLESLAAPLIAASTALAMSST